MRNLNAAPATRADEWPVLKSYGPDQLHHIALPLGGIGTGTVSLGGRGELRDWMIMNVPAHGFSTVVDGNDAPFFSIFVREENGKTRTKALLGPLDDMEFQDQEGRAVNHHGLPRFETASSFDAAYPFGQVNLSDKSMPVKVRIKGFNPLIPGNSDDSGIPIAALTYEVTNITDKPIEVAVCGSLRNFIGKDGTKREKSFRDNVPIGAKANRNRYRENTGEEDLVRGDVRGLYMYSDGVDPKDPAWGTLALTTSTTEGVSYRRSSVSAMWARALADFWEDFSADGVLMDKATLVDDDPMASLAIKAVIAPGETKKFPFYLTWHFPNRTAWSSVPFTNYYATKYADAWDVAVKTVPRIRGLEEETASFVGALCRSSYPNEAKEAALFNLSALRSQTMFRLPSGQLMGWEGTMDDAGAFLGSPNHVYNYELAIPFLFGDLARSMRDIEFNHATRADGMMCTRVLLPLETRAKEYGVTAADGQMGTIMRFYRDWQMSGDDEFLRRSWDNVKNALSFAWVEGGWDADQDGVMEGCQHNTMDVEYYGPNPQMQFWYLGALRAGEEMAKHLDNKPFAKKCRALFQRGSEWTDANLFNGEYYIQQIRPPMAGQVIRKEFREELGADPAAGAKIPDFQMGEACVVDQLVGQMMAHICGLGYLAKPENIRTTLGSIMKYNRLESFKDHFNNMRSFVAGDESGLIMAGWPRARLKVPFPYVNEAMTGFEYAAAIGMLQEEKTADGLQCIRDIRARFNGRKRNPFNEPEAGNNYARSMASWGVIPALSGFNYSAVDQTMSFTAKPGNYFWSNGSAWGTCKVGADKAELHLLHGGIALREFTLTGIGTRKLDGQTIPAGRSLSLTVEKQ